MTIPRGLVTDTLSFYEIQQRWRYFLRGDAGDNVLKCALLVVQCARLRLTLQVKK